MGEEEGIADEQTVTELLERARAGDRAAADRVFELVYRELHRIATRLVGRRSPSPTLQATALVDEAYLRMAGRACLDREHFLALAACAMRSVLVDHAKAKRTQKRAPPGERVLLEELAEAYEQRSRGLVELDAALARLAKLDERLVRVVELRFFTGLPFDEIGRVLGTSERTAERDWQFARLWLEQELRRELG